MQYRTIEKEAAVTLKQKYSRHISYDKHCKTFMYKGEPLDVNKFNYQFLMKEDISISDEKMRNLLQHTCKNIFSSLENYLDKVHLEHSTNNSIDTLTKDIVKCKTQLEEIYLKKFLVGAVARVMQPGCQVDQVLILQSNEQGLYKTSFFRSLAGNAEFSIIRPNMNETELMKMCNAFWLLCYDELESVITKSNLAKVKSFITATHDTWRRYYTTSDFEKIPRTFVLCGTTNQKSFLVDHSGERRFWVVEVSEELDCDWIRANRDRLWAEAVHLYKEGYQWWLTKDEQKSSNELNQNYKKTDSLTQMVIDYVCEKQAKNEQFRIKDICNDLRLNSQRNSLIEILTTQCNLTKPTKQRRVNNVNGYWWN